MMYRSKLLIIALIFLFSIIVNCNKGKSNPLGENPGTSSWQVVFFDNFNRANTVDNDLGTNWIINSPAPTSYVKIKDGEVYSVKQPLVLFVNDVNQSTIRVSAKFKTSSNVPTLFGLIARAKSDYTQGYYCYISNNSKLKLSRYDNGTENVLISKDYTISANASYILELTIDGANITGTLKDYETVNILITLNFSDNKYTNGKVGFKTGTSSAVCMDDFTTEKYE